MTNEDIPLQTGTPCTYQNCLRLRYVAHRNITDLCRTAST